MKTIRVSKVRNVDLETRNVVEFDVVPGVGIKYIPGGRVPSLVWGPVLLPQLGDAAMVHLPAPHAAAAGPCFTYLSRGYAFTALDTCASRRRVRSQRGLAIVPRGDGQHLGRSNGEREVPVTDQAVLNGTGETIEEAALQKFTASLRGELIRPGDDGYEVARTVWNGMIDKHPGLIVRCAGVADVITAVRFGREHDLLVAVRGGGHNVGGNALCDGGLVIDLSAMKGVHVDPVRRTARAQPGVTLGDLDHETQAFRPRHASGHRLLPPASRDSLWAAGSDFSHASTPLPATISSPPMS